MGYAWPMQDELLTMMLQAAPEQADNIRRLYVLSPYFGLLMRGTDEEECRSIFRDLPNSILPDGSNDWLPATVSDDVDLCMRELRIAKRRGMRHVIWWELGLHGDIEKSARHLALLAGGLLQSAFAAAKSLLKPRFGEITGGSFCIIGLGKLGGMELNFGSDVDVLFIWDAPAGVKSDGRRSVDAKEYYQHFSRMLIRLMSEHTNDGITWLVDMRLRPGGDGAPVCMSLDATLEHYQDYGQTWERAMLLKARPVAGDMDLGRRFVDGIAPFIYRRYLDYTTVQSLSDMKRRIDKHSGSHEIAPGFDVKRGRGGIREIEFFIQSLQLLHGGRNEALRVQPSMQALDALVKAGIVDTADAGCIREAYRFWRRVEHAVQARAGEHTHALPEGYADYLSAALGIDGPDLAMREHAAAVYACFSEQFTDLETEVSGDGGDIWLGLDAPELFARLEDMDKASQQRVAAALQKITSYLSRNLLPERAYDQVEHIVAYAMKSWRVDANGIQALECFADLLQHISGRATWVDLLAGNRGVLNWLVDVLAASRYIAGHVSRDPAWMEWALEAERGEDRIRKIQAAIQQLDLQQMDEGSFLADVGRLADQARLTTAMAIASDGVSPLQAGAWLAGTADAVVQAAMRLALKQSDLPDDFPFVCLAMGKHGSREMGLLSDLDMVFVL
ncbi:MAG: bifunctional [glutamate--ammonia ligase]-adenylyl-L-tyrosine phosphorylase/[glutamate--ammonia-ligase] adenylyltransferase, partial [Mariprofundaceae bacterium]